MSKKSKRNHKPPTPRPFPWWWLAVAGVVVLLLGGLAVIGASPTAQPASTPAVTGSPRLAVDRALIDEGYVKLNTTIRSQFRLRNIGDQALRLLGEPQVEVVEGC